MHTSDVSATLWRTIRVSRFQHPWSFYANATGRESHLLLSVMEAVEAVGSACFTPFRGCVEYKWRLGPEHTHRPERVGPLRVVRSVPGSGGLIESVPEKQCRRSRESSSQESRQVVCIFLHIY